MEKAESILELKEWMGHANVQTTMRYLHYKSKANAARRLSEAFAEQTVADVEPGVRVPARLEKACREFNDAVDALEGRDAVLLEDLVLMTVRLYAKVLSIHPFVDGNGRTAFTLLQYALVRCGLACVALDDYAEHQWGLGVALRIDGRQSYDPLQALLVAKLHRVQPLEDD